ncbi:MAG TPA: C1 family peptidase, partial [Verrucomicrobiae bacterium]|nr:C1 family peptidase [Verrucomicrobiae bacterium]
MDLRPVFEKYGFERSQQGARNTCSVFTLTGGLEFAIAKRQGHTTRLSVEFLNWAANRTCGEDEDGGFFSDIWNGYARYGVCAANEFPYQASFDASLSPPPEAVADARKRLGLGLRPNWIKAWNVNTGLTDEEFIVVKRTLAKGWPVSGGFRWPKREQWSANVLQMCGPDAVRDGHSVLLVGYHDDASQPGGGVFIFRNTAGSGVDGLMPYEYARTYMNDAIWIDFEGRSAIPIAKTQAEASYLNPLIPFPRLDQGRNRRISSNEQPDWDNANMDMTILPPGRAIEMPRLQGPGVIKHIWMTSHAGRVNELNSLSIRIYWDDQTEPGVEA